MLLLLACTAPDPGADTAVAVAWSPPPMQACAGLVDPWDLATLDGIRAAERLSFPPIHLLSYELGWSSEAWGDQDCPTVEQDGTVVGGCTNDRGVRYEGSWRNDETETVADGWSVVGSDDGAPFTLAVDGYLRIVDGWLETRISWHWTGTSPWGDIEDVDFEGTWDRDASGPATFRMAYGETPAHAAGGLCADFKSAPWEHAGVTYDDALVLQGSTTVVLGWLPDRDCYDAIVDGERFDTFCVE